MKAIIQMTAFFTIRKTSFSVRIYEFYLKTIISLVTLKRGVINSIQSLFKLSNDAILGKNLSFAASDLNLTKYV